MTGVGSEPAKPLPAIRRAHAWHVRKLLDPTVILKLIEQALAENSARQLTGV
ncbi:MAG TPA: hypothetical protein VHY91_27415 [Pirellulales bacterium]|nr:hypothetical protein [Pirellulales bacterium]